MRGLAYKRFQREKHIKRKENILRSHRLDNPPHKINDKNNLYFPELFNRLFFPNRKMEEGFYLPSYMVKNRGHLNKGKIHCSCPMCSPKSKGRYIRKGRHNEYNYKIGELKRILSMDWDERYGEREEERIKFDRWLLDD